MANLSQVDAERIEAVAGKLWQIEADIAANAKQVIEIIDQLNQGWQSTAKEAFMQTYHEDVAAIEEMIAQYDEVNATLIQAAKDFRANEQELLREIKALR